MDLKMNRGEKAWDKGIGEALDLNIGMEAFLDREEVEEVEEVEEMIDNQPMHVGNGIYIGSIDALYNEEMLKKNDIQHVLTVVTSKEVLEYLEKFSYPLHCHTKVELEDSLDENLLIKIPLFIEAISNAVDQKKSIFVHCVAGVSRSSSAIACWMLVKCSLSLNEALQKIRTVRPWIQPNSNFMKQLEYYSHFIHKKRISTSITPTTSSTEFLEFLPRLNFSSCFIQEIVSLSKTSTIRTVDDKKEDPYSDLERIYPYSLIRATTTINVQNQTTNVQNQTTFAILLVTHIDRIQFQELNEEHVKDEGVDNVAALLELLRQFYPNMKNTEDMMILKFQYLTPYPIEK